MPVIENLPILLVQHTVIRDGVLRLKTRLSQPTRSILAREDVVRLARTIHVSFACDVEDVTYEMKRPGAAASVIVACFGPQRTTHL